MDLFSLVLSIVGRGLVVLYRGKEISSFKHKCDGGAVVDEEQLMVPILIAIKDSK